jgi:hypothetical protein
VTLALELESTIAARAKENQIAGGGDQKSGLTTLSNPIEPINTRSEIAKTAGVSEGTIAKVKKINAKASDETKDKLAKGEISVHKAYQYNRTKKQGTRTDILSDNVSQSPINTAAKLATQHGVSEATP